MAVDGAGNVFVTDYGKHRIVVFQGAAVPAAPGLPERVRPLLAGRDGPAHRCLGKPLCGWKPRGLEATEPQRTRT